MDSKSSIICRIIFIYCVYRNLLRLQLFLHRRLKNRQRFNSRRKSGASPSPSGTSILNQTTSHSKRKPLMLTFPQFLFSLFSPLLSFFLLTSPSPSGTSISNQTISHSKREPLILIFPHFLFPPFFPLRFFSFLFPSFPFFLFNPFFSFFPM